MSNGFQIKNTAFLSIVGCIVWEASVSTLQYYHSALNALTRSFFEDFWRWPNTLEGASFSIITSVLLKDGDNISRIFIYFKRRVSKQCDWELLSCFTLAACFSIKALSVQFRCNYKTSLIEFVNRQTSKNKFLTTNR